MHDGRIGGATLFAPKLVCVAKQGMGVLTPSGHKNEETDPQLQKLLIVQQVLPLDTMGETVKNCRENMQTNTNEKRVKSHTVFSGP